MKGQQRKSTTIAGENTGCLVGVINGPILSSRDLDPQITGDCSSRNLQIVLQITPPRLFGKTALESRTETEDYLLSTLDPWTRSSPYSSLIHYTCTVSKTPQKKSASDPEYLIISSPGSQATGTGFHPVRRVRKHQTLLRIVHPTRPHRGALTLTLVTGFRERERDLELALSLGSA